MNVTIPSGVGHGSILHLEGLGMPYYTGGPAGPLVLTITISTEASPLLLQQGNTEPTVAMSLPNAELPPGEELSVPLERPQALGYLAPKGHPSNERKAASPVFGSNMTSLPMKMARSSAPGVLRFEVFPPFLKPVKRSRVRRFGLLGLVGLLIVALGSGIAWLTLSHPSPAGVTAEFLLPTSTSDPWGITAGPDGNLWFTESSASHIGRISASGKITEFFLTSGSDPVGITAGPDGNLWFTEPQNNQIGRIDTGGGITEFSLPTSDTSPEGITMGPDGNLWFTEWYGNQIGRITSGK